MEILSLEEINKVKAEAEKAPTRAGSKKRNKGVDTADRTVTTWFQLPHTFGTCARVASNECIDERPQKRPGFKNAMTADIASGTEEPYRVCRICFLDGAKSPASKAQSDVPTPDASNDTSVDSHENDEIALDSGPGSV